MSTLLAEVGPTVIEAVNPNDGNSIPPWLAIILAIVIAIAIAHDPAEPVLGRSMRQR